MLCRVFKVDPAKFTARREAVGHYTTIYTYTASTAEEALKGTIKHVTIRRWESVTNSPRRVFLDVLQEFAKTYGCSVLNLLSVPYRATQ